MKLKGAFKSISLLDMKDVKIIENRLDQKIKIAIDKVHEVSYFWYLLWQVLKIQDSKIMKLCLVDKDKVYSNLKKSILSISSIP